MVLVLGSIGIEWYWYWMVLVLSGIGIGWYCIGLGIGIGIGIGQQRHICRKSGMHFVSRRK
jgi:hypothetical protein